MTRTAAPSRLLPTLGGRQRLSLIPLVLVIVAVWLGWVWLAPVSVADAGEWVQRSCSYGTEYIFPEGWEGRELNGYKNPNQGTPFDGCLGFNQGGGL